MDYSQKIPDEIMSMRNTCSKTYSMPDGMQKLVAFREPIHYERDGVFYDIDTTIQDEKVENAPYMGNILNDSIGFTIARKDTGKEMSIEVSDIGWVPTGYKDPLLSDNRAVYEDVSKGVDIIIQFNDNGAKAWRMLKTPEAEKTIVWKVTQDEEQGEISINPTFYGRDSDGREVILKTEVIDELVENGKKVYYIKDVFTGKTLEIDKKTRVRRESDKVKYPVMIDPEVRIKGLLKLEDKEVLSCQL